MNADKIPVPAQPEVLLHCLMDIAEALLAVGAEVNRVEDTLTRMGTAYGAVRMNAFVITSSIVVTMTLPSGRDITQTLLVYLGSALAAGSCALFFGGSMTDGLVAALFGLVICRLQRHFGPQCPNRLVFNLLSALAVGISITLCAFFLPAMRLIETLLWAGALAMGFMSAFLLMGGIGL